MLITTRILSATGSFYSTMASLLTSFLGFSLTFCYTLYVKSGELYNITYMHINLLNLSEVELFITATAFLAVIRESVDSLCRDGADAIYAILKQKPYNFTTNALKA